MNISNFYNQFELNIQPNKIKKIYLILEEWIRFHKIKIISYLIYVAAVVKGLINIRFIVIMDTNNSVFN